MMVLKRLDCVQIKTGRVFTVIIPNKYPSRNCMVVAVIIIYYYQVLLYHVIVCYEYTELDGCTNVLGR